jgi:hypothetical protein
MKTIVLAASILVVLAGGARSALAAPIVVSTLPSWNGSASIGDFGAAGFSAWGQFFVAPSGTNRLLDFSFLLSDGVHGSNTNPVPVVMQAHLVQYNPFTRLIIGPTLYSSAEITVPVTSALQFELYKFEIDAAVIAGSTYMMFLFANNFELQIPDDSRLRLATSGSDLAGGAYNIPASAFADLDTALASQWRFTAGTDLAFSATFDNRPTAPVPEPDTLLLLATAGAAGLWAARRRPAGSMAQVMPAAPDQPDRTVAGHAQE